LIASGKKSGGLDKKKRRGRGLLILRKGKKGKEQTSSPSGKGGKKGEENCTKPSEL